MMAGFRKIVWAEGVMLGQQHFQQWDKHQYSERQLSRNYGLPYHWGIAEMRIDEASLAQGKISINRLTALMPDRRWVNFDRVYDGCLERDLPQQGKQRVSVYLGLPSSEQVNSITGYAAPIEANVAWQGEYQSLHDLYDPAREREVLLARQNLQLYFDDEFSTGMTLLKIAEVEFSVESRSYRLYPSYIPPVMTISASAHFLSWLTEMTGQLTKHIKILSEQKDKHRHVQNQFGYADFIYFNLIKTLSTHLARLSALQQMPQAHPLAVYDVCSALLGELSGYLDDPLSVGDFTAYQQQHLTQVFTEMKDSFDELIDAVIPANTIDISLEKIKEHYYQSGALSGEDLKQKQFCLALYHEQLTETLIEKVKTQVKISAPSKLDDIVLTFTKGVSFDYLSAPGKDLMAKRNYHYFLLKKEGQGWQDIISEEKIAFFVSQELANCAFELISY